MGNVDWTGLVQPMKPEEMFVVCLMIALLFLVVWFVVHDPRQRRTLPRPSSRETALQEQLRLAAEQKRRD